MSYLTCLCEIFPWACHKVTYSEVKVTEICHNDRIALIDVRKALLDPDEELALAETMVLEVEGQME